MVATVIVPLDGSELAARALPYARSLASAHNATIELVSIIDVPIEFSSWIGTSRLPESSEVKQWIAEREGYLRQVAASNGINDVVTSVTIGRADEGIFESSSEANDPVIVMASHGRTGFRRMISGSVTVRVVRRASCPVIVIPAHGEDTVSTALTAQVLVPLDGSELAEHALDSAIETLGLTMSHVHLLRVAETPTLTAPSGMGAPVAVDYSVMVEYEEEARRESERYLERVAATLANRGIQAIWEVHDGDPAEVISAAASEQGAHIIAMATHGRGGVNRVAFGSVAEHVIANIEIPLFLHGPVGEDTQTSAG